jgi:hypothetical protein
VTIITGPLWRYPVKKKTKPKPKPKSRMPAAWRVDYKAAVARATKLQADNTLLRQQAASVRHELKAAEQELAAISAAMPGARSCDFGITLADEVKAVAEGLLMWRDRANALQARVEATERAQG